MKELLEVGKIANTHGIKGAVKIVPLTDDPGRYDSLKWVYLEDKNQNKNEKTKLNIEWVKYQKTMVIVKFKEINTMEAAEKLKETYITIDRENAVKLQKDSYFICDLLGLEIYEENGNKLGVLKDIIKTGSNDVYDVKPESGGKSILIPVIKSVVLNIDIAAKKITVRLPKGLLDDEV